MITRREFVEGLGSAALVGRALSKSPKDHHRPNVVAIMSDDHGAWANRCYGCTDIYTPNLDKLAGTGTRFQNTMACTPVCSPSRMTYLTGLLPSAHGVQDYLQKVDSCGPKSRQWLAGFTTYTEVLAANGYELGMCGKWHMGKDEEAQAGFTDWNTVPSGGGPYKNPTFVRNGKSVPFEGFREDGIGDFALEFLDKQKNSEKPFFLAVNFYAPHTPYSYQPEAYRKPNLTSTFSCFPDLPMNPAENPGLKEEFGKHESKLAYSSLITGIDANIGRILQKLEELGVRDNTLVIYTADHGWNAGHHGVWGKGNGTIPLNMYEESLRVPMIWNHPGHIRSGAVVHEIISSYDFFPTILEYLNIPVARDRRRVGRSYAEALKGGRLPRRDRLYFEYASVRCVRTLTMKYVERTDGWPSELYDLAKDPRETQNLIGDPRYSASLTELKEDLAAYFRAAGAPPLSAWRTTTKQDLPSESDQRGPGTKTS